MSIIDQYELHEELGQGAIAIVYRATDLETEQEVAVKVIHSQLAANEYFQELFVNEAISASKLRHPNIIRTYRYSPKDDQLFFVMEYIPGGSLRNYVKRLKEQGERMTLLQAVELVMSVARGAHYAHQNNMIHRDLKPENLLVFTSPITKKLELIITDFGAVKLIQQLGDDVDDNRMIGTLDYMSPEQCLRQNIDARSDIYAIGVILHELVVGHRPHIFSTRLEAEQYHRQPVPIDATTLPAELPLSLREIITRCLSPLPQDRYPDARECELALAEVAHQLQGIGSDEDTITVIESPPDMPAEGPKSSLPLMSVLLGAEPLSKVPTVQDTEFRVSLSEDELEVVPGDDVQFFALVENIGEISDHATVSVKGLPAKWVKLSKAEVKLMPQKTFKEAKDRDKTLDRINITISLPRDSKSRAGRHPFQIRVASTSRPGAVFTATGFLTILPYYDFTVELKPQVIHGSGQFKVIIHNLSNIEDTYIMQANDPESILKFKGRWAEIVNEKRKLPYAPGGKSKATVDLIPPRREFIGQQKVTAFKIGVRSTRSKLEKIEQGSLIAYPYIKSQTLLMLALLAGLLSGLAVLIFSNVVWPLESNRLTQTAQAEMQVATQTAAIINTAQTATQIEANLRTAVAATADAYNRERATANVQATHTQAALNLPATQAVQTASASTLEYAATLSTGLNAQQTLFAPTAESIQLTRTASHIIEARQAVIGTIISIQKTQTAEAPA